MASKFAQLAKNEKLYNRQTVKFKLRSREQRYNNYFRFEKLFLRK